MKNLLVPINFSSSSNSVCNYALKLAYDLSAKITILYVIEKPLFLAGLSYTVLLEEANRKMERHFRKMQAAAPQVKMEYDLLQGDFAESLCEYAAQHKTELIVLATGSGNFITRTLTGNAIIRILRNAPCMVLEVPKTAKYKGFSKIVYATDLTDENLGHLQYFLPLARFFQSEILLLYVNNFLKDPPKKNIQTVVNQLRKKMHWSAINGYVCDDTSVSDGISYFLHKKAADCLAIYSPHHTMLENLFRKSTLKKASLQNTLPLLVIHEKDKSLNMARQKIKISEN
jgi:nucleotide-binding universal stress UspA family protein